MIYDRAYGPFGEPYAETATTNRDFTGQTEDTTPGLYDFLFRQYSWSQGRWLVPDPAGLAAVDITNPQTWNRYAYVGNNPLSNVDPLGLDCVPAFFDDFDYVALGNCEMLGDDWGDGCESFFCIYPGGGGGGGIFPHRPPSAPPPPPSPMPVHFPDETLGIPNGLPTPNWGLAAALIPPAICGDITCPTIGNSFAPALAAPICVAAPEVCIIGGIGLTIYAIEKFGPALIQQIKDATQSTTFDDCEVQESNDLAQCLQVPIANGARGRCYESVTKRRWACDNGRSLPPLVKW